jgi:hypothetical protein
VANLFDLQGFGALSEWNGQFSSASALQAYQTIASLGSNSIELAVRLWTQSQTSNAVIADPSKTEADSSLLASFKAAEVDGLSVVFKPEITGLDGTASYQLAPSDVASFFASYKAEIVHLATIAQEGGVATFAIGNEMGSLTGAQYRSYWTDIILASLSRRHHLCRGNRRGVESLVLGSGRHHRREHLSAADIERDANRASSRQCLD